MTKVIFQDYQGLGILKKKIQDFPGGAGTICNDAITTDPTAFDIKMSASLSFLVAGRVMSPALRPYVSGPMRNLDIQNLIEAFASVNRGLQCSKAR